MKRSLLLSLFAIAVTAMTAGQSKADTLQLTLDLNNAVGNQSASGGTWQLFARKVEGAGGVNGDNGIAGIRAILSGVNATGITYGAGINHSITCNGSNPCTDTLSNGNVEIVYGQNISAAGVLTTVGIPQAGQAATRDTLIASGTWPAGATRPAFAADPDGFLSEGNFLNTNAAPFGNSIEASGANVTRTVVTLGDFNNSNTVTAADTAPYRRQLLGTDPYNPAGDFNQSGTVTAADTGSYRAELLETALVASVSVVPEPSTFGLALLAGMGLIGRRRCV